ncbi:MAG: phosphotransferase [Anaerolineae bacterium]
MEHRDLGEPVAIGRTADIHKWGEGTVVKLYHDWFQFEWIQGEATRSREVGKLDFPIPKVGEMVKVNGRNGLIFEHLDGQNMLANLKETPERLPDFAKRLAKLHLDLHQVDEQLDLPTQHGKLEHNIRRAAPLSAEQKEKLVGLLHQMPKKSQVCHGDFHPGNIVVTANGEAIVDWNDCSMGNPIADVARSSILFLGGITGNEVPDPAFEKLVTECHDQYLAHYFAFSGVGEAGKDEYKRWLPIIAGARLAEGITTLEPWLLSEVEKINHMG